MATAGTLVAITASPSKAFAAEATLNTNFSRNHGHIFVASLKELLAAGKKDYDIKGTSSHSHTLTIADEILRTLQQTRMVDVDSSEDFGHSHTARIAII